MRNAAKRSHTMGGGVMANREPGTMYLRDPTRSTLYAIANCKSPMRRCVHYDGESDCNEVKSRANGAGWTTIKNY